MMYGVEQIKKHCLNRWYPLIDHPTQLDLIHDKIRFKVVPAGRRSGKTERAKRFVAKKLYERPNQDYFIAAPTRNQVKKIYWNDMKLLTMAGLYGHDAIKESELMIRLPNNSSVTLIGLDKPQRIEGTAWAGGVVDEIADIKEDAWEENIAPALDTYDPLNPNERPWCWLIGVPDGLNHYYELAEYCKTEDDPDWKLYTWKSADILPSDIIEAAKRRMSAKQYRQEYEASFETVSGKIYEDYNVDNQVNSTIKPHEQLLWFHDFNYTPLSSGIGVQRNRGKSLYILDEIILTSAVAKQSALEFVDKFQDHKNRKILLFGDPSGKAGEKHGQISNYIEIEKVLKEHNWQVERKVKRKAPSIRDRQNSVRAKIRNANDEVTLFVNPKTARYCHKGLSTVQVKKGSTFLEDDTSEYQHITTGIGYCIDYLWPVKREKTIGKKSNLQPSTHHW